MISDWRTISGELAEPPRRRQPQLWVESRPPLRPTGVFLAVVRRRDRHRRAPGGANVDGLQAVAPHPPGQVAHEGARRVANRGGAHRALQHGGEGGRRRTRPRWPAAALRTAPLPLPTWALEHAPQTPAPAGGQCAGGRECCEDRSRGSGCRWRSCPFQRTIMGSPSRNVQYHPPRLSEDRLNLPQPHSPSLPTHCSGKSGMRPRGCTRRPGRRGCGAGSRNRSRCVPRRTSGPLQLFGEPCSSINWRRRSSTLSFRFSRSRVRSMSYL